MAERKALGKGLSALLGVTEGSAPLEKIYSIGVGEIRPDPDQPRREMDGEGLDSLAASIRAHGVLQPLLLRAEAGGGYRIVAGERRWRAAALAGLTDVPARVLNASEEALREISLIENVQRKDLTPIEIASALQALIRKNGLTQEDCAAHLGWSRALVANRLRLLNLPDELRGMLADGSLSEGHARALLGLDSEEAMTELARRAAGGGMTVRQLEAAVRDVQSGAVDPELKAVPRGRFRAVRLPRPLRAYKKMGVKIRVGRRDGAARIVLEELRDVDDERLLQGLEECLKRLYPDSGGGAE
ncbi:MAG: ParB/RepB/Spo0J family partition protein [Fretibacterium sp.]|nr:ParB/RepB/Spo0J family partition protein [Fretibacterium sp.]